jgi:hypothetical protein
MIRFAELDARNCVTVTGVARQPCVLAISNLLFATPVGVHNSRRYLESDSTRNTNMPHRGRVQQRDGAAGANRPALTALRASEDEE